MHIGRVSGCSAGSLKTRLVALFIALALANLALWALAGVALHDRPVMLGAAFLAYSFGLRHAVDADHIAAIDNVTRKLMQRGSQPIGVGFFFSLGHSSIVFALTGLVAGAAYLIRDRFQTLETVGGLIGTLISAGFLIAIATMNLVVLASVIGVFRKVRAGQPFQEQEVDILLASRGFFGRLFRGVFALIDQSWKMYFVGFLFGLGFDTATEVGLLGLSTTQASQGTGAWSLMLLPALFAAGMALVDTADNALMVGAYGWAFAKPIRKLYYNITVTALSAAVALFVGGIEALGLVQNQMSLSGPFWRAVAALNDNFGLVGYGIIGLFALSWLASFILYRARGYDRIGVEAAQ
jgi:high-affinity nickel-transport protein